MVVSSSGVRARLQRPLDFLVVADHAENLGLAPLIAEKNPDLLKTDFGKKISDLVYTGKYLEAYKLWGEGMETRKDPLAGNEALTRTLWEQITAAAEKFNEPGKFTALIGFEWTSSPGGNDPDRFKRIVKQMQSVKLITLSEFRGGKAKPINDIQFPTVGKTDADVFGNNLLLLPEQSHPCGRPGSETPRPKVGAS
jgi:hypothetical protein